MDNRRVVFNPELEEIRNRVLRESEVQDDKWIRTLINKTSRIHAGFLFEDLKALQDLCLYIGESQNKLTDPGCQAFGYHLGLNPSVLKVINHNFNNEDPTWNTLLAFVQYEDATIGKIIQALLNLGRLDVIHRIKKSINDLADIVLQLEGNLNFNNSSGETSDYGSQLMSNEKNAFSSASDSDNVENKSTTNAYEFPQCSYQDIIKPYELPPAPFIFKNIKTTSEITSLRIQQSFYNRNTSLNEFQKNESDLEPIEVCYKQRASSKSHNDINVAKLHENSQASALQNCNTVSNNNKKYSKIVMLTFASDGEQHAKEICQILRSKRDSLKRIGVLILAEHIKEVVKDPYNFITGAFHQVDYVCPILTQSYFNIIRRKEESSHLSDLHLDSRYVQFIYALMNKYYTSNACLNDKIRCIIPDELVSNVHCNLFMTIPIFSAWVKLSEVDEMADQLIKGRI